MAGLDGDFQGPGRYGNGSDRLQTGVTFAGAAISLALVIGLGVWGYKLAVRDVSGIPVVRAAEGPIRIAPDKPGGEIADHQGLAVNEVAASGTAAIPADRLLLAPRPVDLALDDMAGLSPVIPPSTDTAVAESLQTALAPEPTPEAAQTEDAIAMALAEALSGEQGAELVDGATLESGVSRSLLPRARPGDGVAAVTDVSAQAATATEAAALPDIVEVSAESLQPGTRLVQFGAFDTPAAARAEWVKMQGQFASLMADKAMVIEQANSGGRDFFRLRAHGFADEDEARRFCSAMQMENAACIPVAHR